MIWKDVNGYGGNYQASSKGDIRSKDRIVEKFSALCGNKLVSQKYKGKDLKQFEVKGGYRVVRIGFNRKKYTVQVGRLVLLAFMGVPRKGTECCHNDGNASNNSVSNLRWDTHANNNKDRLVHGTYKHGTDHHFSKFSADLIDSIKRGELSKKEAMSKGVSHTHYYRLKSSS